MTIVLVATFVSVVARSAVAATPPTLNLNVLLIGTGSSDPTTAAWQSALSSEGVAYTLATATGAYGSETVTLPALTAGSVGNFNAVVIADSSAGFAAGQLTSLFSYESTHGVRQIDGYTYPIPAQGIAAVSGASNTLDNTTATLTTAGLAGLPGLKGTVPFDAGTYGVPASVVAGTIGAAFTPWLENASGQVLAGVYQHPGISTAPDPQAGVSELSLTFDYNATQLQWLLLAPGLIDWVTQDTHLGLSRNYFGQDVDDNFIADNEWSSQYQCTPAATQPDDYTCPAAVQGAAPGSAPGVPADVQMSATDVAYLVAWEQSTGIKLNLAFNGIGACTAPTAADESSAICTGSVTDPGGTYSDPGQNVDASYPNDQGLVNALLADKADFNWINHTWSHQFLGCIVWQPQVLTSATANATAGTLGAGTYSYEITAATAYGESEPSTPQPATTSGTTGSVTLSWPDATNGVGTDGTAGPTLAAEEANHTGGSGFWGYNVYREDPGTTTYGLIGQVPENGTAPTYSYTDTGATAPGVAPGSSDTFPTATNPGIDCSDAAGSWDPATSTTADASIEQEIGLNQAFATANGLPNYNPAALVTGEHSGIESPNMPAALAGNGVTTVATDASRQPTQYSLGAAASAPRYPSNIYYNASNWPDELNEYNTLYVAPGTSLGDATYPTETGDCASSSATTCLSAPATESSLLASESRIMLSHVLANNPRVGYAHQTDLIGPATQTVGGVTSDYGYTLLSLINSMLTQYDAWTSTAAPLVQMTDTTEAQVLAQQSAWGAAQTAGSVKATEHNGVVTVTNAGTSAVDVPVTTPQGTTVGGAAYGQSYGGQLSTWTSIGAGGSLTLTEHVAPTIISANSASSIVGAAFSATVYTTGEPAPALTEAGALPAGVTFTDNGNGTATLAGTATAGSGGLYPITITAANGVTPNATQAFTLTNSEAPTITSAPTASFYTGLAGTYTVTTTGYPAATITETGALPTGLTFTDKGNGTATIAGTPAAGTSGKYPVTISAANSSGSTANLALAVTVTAGRAPVITSGATAYFTLNAVGAFAVSTTGAPTPAITEVGALPAGLTFTDNNNGTALLSGTPTASGTTTLTVTAANGITPNATQTLTVIVGQGPAITSAASTTFTTGAPGTFSVTTTGYPAPALGETGALPAGVTFVGNSNGTATISGTPTATSGGSYPITITATNGTGTVNQAFTLTVDQAPAITSATSTTFTTGAPGTFAVIATGYPAPTLTETGALPAGVTFIDNGMGTATLAGTAAAGTGGSYPIIITATNGTSPNATQSFTLKVDQAPAITSATSTTFAQDAPGTFSVTTSGYPAPTLTETGGLPTGVTFTDNGSGAATLAGTAAWGSAGSYPVTITAANGTGSDRTQSFSITVPGVPALAGGDRLAATPDGTGYWIVGPTGSLSTYGTAGNYGSMAGHQLNRPIVGVGSTPDGKGYWMVASDGGVFSFGDAQFHGSMGGVPLNMPIVGIAGTPDGTGYWMVASDGGVFSFGDAGFYGSTGNIKLNKPVIGMTATRDGHGYWLVASDGGIFNYGDAGFYGSGGSAGRTAVGLIASPTGPGYALIDTDGTRTAFGG